MSSDKYDTKRIAIIGASYLQLPLICRAKEMGLETHVFSWGKGEEGEAEGDYFYPISIVEKEAILDKCSEIAIDGICSIASDLASITVNYVASRLGLTGNGMECTNVSTNKARMRERFIQNGVPSPRSMELEAKGTFDDEGYRYPLIVKPTDRSGSRGVTKVYNRKGLDEAIRYAVENSFDKRVIVEEFVQGREYSVEYISWHGEHTFLAITQKFTTGSPHFIEKGHFEPALLSRETVEKVKIVVTHALDSLEIRNGASHSEVMITDEGEIFVIEVGARMGGDLIGSSLVELTTGVDFVGDVIRVALGVPPRIERKGNGCALVRFIFDSNDIRLLKDIKNNNPKLLVEDAVFFQEMPKNVSDSSERAGYFLLRSDNAEVLLPFFPN